MFNYFQDLYINHIFGYEYIVTNIILALFIALIMNLLPFKGTKNILLKVLDWFLTWLVSFIVSNIHYYLIGLDYMQFVAWSIAVLPHIFLFPKKSFTDKVTKATTILPMIFSSLVLSAEIGEIVTFDDNWPIGLTTVIILVSMILCAVWMSYFSTEEYKAKNNGVFIVVIIFFITSTTISIISHTQVLEQWYLIITNFFFMINAISLYYVYFFAIKKQSENSDYVAINIKKTNDLYLLKRSIDNLKDLQKIRHDLKNQYQYMKELLNQQKYEELNTFFSDMSETSFVPLHYIDCGNTPISISLNQAINRASYHNIKINSSIIVPKELSVTDLDISRLLSNALDNAIDAIINEKIENASININIKYNNPYLFISIDNPITEEAAKNLNLTNLKTTKSDKSIHGYGTKIIADIANKNEGSVDFTIKDGKFMLDAMLKAKEVKE